jgi:hypothetical protein
MWIAAEPWQKQSPMFAFQEDAYHMSIDSSKMYLYSLLWMKYNLQYVLKLYVLPLAYVQNGEKQIYE